MGVSKPVRHITTHQSVSDWFRQLIDRRETLLFFVWKDLKVQYQNPVLGLLWSIFQPLIYFAIILAVMNFSGRNSNQIEMPFALYLISGLTIWNFVTSAILGSMNSTQSNAGIISKAFFPRFYLIVSPVLKSTLNLLIMLMIVFGFAIGIGQPVGTNMLLFLSVSVITILLVTVGVAAVVTSLVVQNRHVRHAIPIIMYAMLFALPVFYSMHSIDNPVLVLIYQLNPIAGSMEMLRAGFGSEVDINHMIGWLILSVIWLLVGIIIFRNTERKLADLI
jgi:lipopolysaccharide transport system permease protein